MRLIDADELIHLYFDDEDGNPVFDFVPWEFVENAPTIEAEPVKHGRWIEERSGKVLDLVKYHCSECGRWQTWSNFPYCPNCGAKMDEVEENG